MIRDEVLKNAAADMASKKESTIKIVLDETIPEGWTLADVKKRCRMVRVAGNPVETLHVDGVPVVEFWPIESEMVPTETGWTYKVTQKYRKLTV